MVWSDTVDAAPTTPLLVEVRTDNGEPVPGVSVELKVLPATGPNETVVFLGPLTAETLDFVVTDETDADGRAGAFVRFGTRIGVARVAISAGDRLRDTVDLTVEPGRVALLSPTVLTRTVYPDTRFAVEVSQRDRHGNPSRGTVTVEIEHSAVASTTTLNQVVSGPGFGFTHILFSADGVTATSRLAVVPRGTLAIMEGHSGDVSEVSLDGSTRRVLTRAVRGIHGFVSFLWVPGRDELIVSQSGELWHELNRYTAGGAMTRISPPQGELGFHASAPSIPEDRSWIYVFAHWRNGIDLWRMRLNGTQLEPVPTPGVRYRMTVPAVSPDGTRIAYVDASQWGDGEVRVYHLGSGQASAWGVIGTAPTWSPSGEWIAFIDRNGAVQVVAADGSEHRTLSTPGSSYVPTQITWSPDGNWVAATNAETRRIDLLHLPSGATIPLDHTGDYLASSWKR